MVHFVNLIFSKKYGTLYSLLKDLVTRKITRNSANADQMSFMIDLMYGYGEGKLIDIETLKNEFFYNSLNKSKTNFFRY